jgi:hypothetical protein
MVSEPISYVERTRSWYAALGYPAYQWAAHADAPFQPLERPLGQLTVALVTTAAPYRPELGDQGPGAPYNASAKFFAAYDLPVEPIPDLRISHVSYDRAHTTATDPASWLPVAALRDAERTGRIGRLADRLIGLPTNRSQRATVEQDAPDVLARCRALGADAAVLVPNCPVCHQSASLVARHLEAQGITTVVMGCALDIVERARVPRFLFSDFPLGNSAGKPHDPRSQQATLALALDLLESAGGPCTTWVSPQRWAADERWKQDFMNIELLPPARIAELRAEHAEQRRIAKELKGRS